MAHSTYTVIVYRKNKLITSLGHLQEAHDSSMSVNTFTSISALEAFLEQEHLTDLRRNDVESWSAMNEYTFLIDGVKSNQFFEASLFNAMLNAEHEFAFEVQAKRAEEARLQAEHDARWAALKRERDLVELKRILKTYSVEELRNELAGELRL